MTKDEREKVKALLRQRPELARMIGLSVDELCGLLDDPSVDEDKHDVAFSSLLEMAEDRTMEVTAGPRRAV